MIMYDILLILQYQVSTTVMDLVAVFALFVFMLALLCFCVATVFFSVNKDLYLYNSESLLQQATAGAFGKLSNSLLWSLMINIFDKTVSRPLARGSCRRPPPLSYATAARHGPVRTGPGPSTESGSALEWAARSSVVATQSISATPPSVADLAAAAAAASLGPSARLQADRRASPRPAPLKSAVNGHFPSRVAWCTALR